MESSKLKENIMPGSLLEGKPIASSMKDDIRNTVKEIFQKHGKVPTLLSIQIGQDPGSTIYVKSQMKVAEDLGLNYVLKNYDLNISENDLISHIKNFNSETSINGMILQMPLPKHIDAKKVINLISPLKDAEGMHPENLGRVLLGDDTLAPCTALSCLKLIEATKVDLYGKEAVIVGHSDIVGKPITLMLLNKFATTTTCHIATSQRNLLEEHVKKAEILVVAVGKAGIIKGSWIKENAIVIDVGINRVEGKIVGDIEFDEASKRAGFITPVPGGVGALTVTILMRNVVNAFKLQNNI